MKKVLLIISILLLTACAKANKLGNTSRKKTTNGILEFVNTQFEYGGLYKLNEIFTNKDIVFEEEYLIYDDLGKNEMDIIYHKDDKDYKEKFSFEVIDTTKPLVWLSGSYTVYIGNDNDLTKKIICADNHDKIPDCSIEGTYNLEKVGDYQLKYIAKDQSGNVETIPFVLHVRNKPQGGSNNSHETTSIDSIIKKYKNETTLIGIDVSKYQGDIDWKKVKTAGVEFAMIRLGLGYDDVLKLDEKFQQNINGALDNDIQVGLYFYSYAINLQEAISHANYVIENIKDYNVTFPIAFDWENFSHWNEYQISLHDLHQTSNAFLDTIEEHGYKALQYGSRNYLRAFWAPIKHDIWLAHYGVDQSNYENKYIMWQLCNNGRVDGINGDVDIDIYYK